MTSAHTEKENNRCNVRGWSTLRKEESVFDERVGNSRRSSVAVDRCNSSEKPNNLSEIPTDSADAQTYITEDRTQMLDRWQTYHRNTTSAVTTCTNCQKFDCYGCEYKQTERSE